MIQLVLELIDLINSETKESFSIMDLRSISTLNRFKFELINELELKQDTANAVLTICVNYNVQYYSYQNPKISKYLDNILVESKEIFPIFKLNLVHQIMDKNENWSKWCENMLDS